VQQTFRRDQLEEVVEHVAHVWRRSGSMRISPRYIRNCKSSAVFKVLQSIPR
jgi:hypothetical protein